MQGLYCLGLAALLLAGCRDVPTPTLSARPTPSVSASPGEPQLSLSSGRQRKTFTRSQLLANQAHTVLPLLDQSAYPGQTLSFDVVPLSALLSEVAVPTGRELHYETLDGFASSFPADQAVSTDPARAVAYLAIEDPGRPWPKLGKSQLTAGPFYLIWSHPERSRIGREEWPYQIKSLTLQAPVTELYPLALPSSQLADTSPPWLGFKVFVKNCFACHSINGQGAAHLGPDLDLPMNPTEYLQSAALRKLIRNPRSVRTWADSKMPAFPPDVLAEADLDVLVAYLRHMAGRKTP